MSKHYPQGYMVQYHVIRGDGSTDFVWRTGKSSARMMYHKFDRAKQMAMVGKYRGCMVVNSWVFRVSGWDEDNTNVVWKRRK